MSFYLFYPQLTSLVTELIGQVSSLLSDYQQGNICYLFSLRICMCTKSTGLVETNMHLAMTDYFLI